VLELLAEEAAYSLLNVLCKRTSVAVVSAALIYVFETQSHLVLARLMSSAACSACCRCQEEGQEGQEEG
jgi:hypothetical protein